MDFEKESVALLAEHGAKLERTRKHRCWRMPDGRTFVMGKSWSDRRASENNYRDLLKFLGIEREIKKNPERKAKPGIKRAVEVQFCEVRGKSFADKLREALS